MFGYVGAYPDYPQDSPCNILTENRVFVLRWGRCDGRVQTRVTSLDFGTQVRDPGGLGVSGGYVFDVLREGELDVKLTTSPRIVVFELKQTEEYEETKAPRGGKIGLSFPPSQICTAGRRDLGSVAIWSGRPLPRKRHGTKESPETPRVFADETKKAIRLLTASRVCFYNGVIR